MIYDKIAMNNGVIFKYVYDILNERMYQGINNKAQGKECVDRKADLDASLFVVVVNGSFACELFMKSMLPQGTRGHKLADLFELLDNNIQSKIRRKTIDRMKERKKIYGDTEFENDLKCNNNKFAEWRYFHEGNAQLANLEFISCFMRALFEVINEER